MKRFFIALCLLLGLTLISTLSAQIKFSGMTESSIYMWENIDAVQQVDYYQHVNLRLSMESYRDLYLKTFFKYGRNGDPAEWNEKVYNTYLNFLSPCRKWEARLGRQFVYNGVMNGTVDGMLLTIRPIKRMSLKLIAGMEAPFDRSLELTSWDDGNVLGAYGSYGFSEAFNLKASYYQKTRSDNVYWQLVGGALSGKIMNSVYYQAQYDHNLKTSDYQTMRLRLSYFKNAWRFFSEYNSQKPKIYEDSFFQIFKQEAFNQVRAGFGYQLGKYNIGVHDVYTMYDENESSNQVHATLSGSYGMVGLLYQSGYAGENVGVYGSVRYNVLKDLLLQISSSYYQYEC